MQLTDKKKNKEKKKKNETRIETLGINTITQALRWPSRNPI